MSSLLVVDSLVVNTQSSGQCCIELCQGDITQLDIKDKVDVLCVSVFGSRYTPLSDTLVGALHEKLKLSVKLLARDKEEDLRHAYMCWWSKPLAENLPYRKLLCFENRGKVCRPQELVGNVFRCLVPILNNEPGTVITPLLNTGIQGVDEAAMLVGMVEAAVKWMKAGLPLKQLKIVLYANVVGGKVVRVNMRDSAGILKAFGALKEQHNNCDITPPDVPLEYDIYLSYSAKDVAVASLVEDTFRASKPDIRIYKSSQVLDDQNRDQAEASYWLEEVFKIMLKCARVVPILSASFLESKACVDLFNMALCCNRRAQRDLLAPLYIERIEDMPTYMGLVQYFDCSPKDEAKISEGCEHLVQSLEHASTKVHTVAMTDNASPLHYDVFVSYSHADFRLAVSIVEKLQEMNPELRIFFDRQELKTGIAWQRTLYHAIDGCRSFMALVSNSYMKSAMCIEEFNLALAKHCSSDSMLRFIPVCIETLAECSPEFQRVKLINATPRVFDRAVEVICFSLVEWIGGRDWYPQLDTIFRRRMGIIVDATDCVADRRRLQFTLKYGKGDKILKRDDVTFPPSIKGLYNPSPTKGDEPCDIAFSYAPENKLVASVIARILREVSPELVLGETADTESKRLALMESARKVVVILSSNYLESAEQVEEFHTVLLRQRYRSSTQVLFLITINRLPQLPTYFHLVPCEFNLFDALWMDLYSKHKATLSSDLEDLWRMLQGNADNHIEIHVFIGILAAIHSLLQQLKVDREHPPATKTNHQPILFNVLLLRTEVMRLLRDVSDEAGREHCEEEHQDMKSSGGDCNSEKKDGGSSSPENFLLDIVELPEDTAVFKTPESQPARGTDAASSCHRQNLTENANSSNSYSHCQTEEVDAVVNENQSGNDNYTQHQKERPGVSTAGSGTHENRSSSRSCMLI